MVPNGISFKDTNMAILRVNKYGHQQFLNIQFAINAAKPGDRIIVDSDIYNEQIVVSKNDITIEGLVSNVDLGPSRNAPTLSGIDDNCTAIVINAASNVNIKGFFIQGYDNGIIVSDSSNITIENMSLTTHNTSILSQGNNTNISINKNMMNVKSIKSYGMELHNINSVQILNNKISANLITSGISLFSCLNENISNNIFDFQSLQGLNVITIIDGLKDNSWYYEGNELVINDVYDNYDEEAYDDGFIKVWLKNSFAFVNVYSDMILFKDAGIETSMISKANMVVINLPDIKISRYLVTKYLLKEFTPIEKIILIYLDDARQKTYVSFTANNPIMISKVATNKNLSIDSIIVEKKDGSKIRIPRKDLNGKDWDLSVSNKF